MVGGDKLNANKFFKIVILKEGLLQSKRGWKEKLFIWLKNNMRTEKENAHLDQYAFLFFFNKELDHSLQ